MGKPAAADLKLGLATAPVLFACEKVSAHFATSPRHFRKYCGNYFDHYYYNNN
jgi:decaprenyl-diphosphate synthase subunit 1